MRARPSSSTGWVASATLPRSAGCTTAGCCRAERITHSAVAARANGTGRGITESGGTGGCCEGTRRRCTEPRSLLPGRLLQTESRRDTRPLLVMWR